MGTSGQIRSPVTRQKAGALNRMSAATVTGLPRLVALEQLSPTGLHRLADALASNETQPVFVVVQV